ncbi:polysaccharide deacetylase family protein [Alkalilacustris brevis]|uniref:polysaccharide deacetylase family protein n=1 Tax=Alkalilacustris brevis TaxID=2026338 RepID=UPI00138FC9C5|nr:polysaccharide deacetylase family protein [Alkalilacustris brevis]
MYHYVREADSSLPNFRYLHIDNFRRQLDHFDANYGFVSRQEWAEVLKKRDVSVGQNKVLLTFDDAMSCHFTHVFPELQDRGLWGIFYVPVQPYLTGKMLDVHRVHLLCGAFEGDRLLTLARDLVSDDMIPFEKRQDFHQKTYTTQTNVSGVSEFKRLINYFCEERFRAQLLDEIMAELGSTGISSDFYVSETELLEMQKGGMMLGSHTVSHPVMSKLDEGGQTRELHLSFEFLDRLGVVGPRTYCHPYGGFHSFDATTVALLDDIGVQWSFNVESRDIENADLSRGRQHLPRYDCNEFPHGSAS